MNYYSAEKKAEVLARLAPPENLTIPQLSQAEGISKTALRNWLKESESMISSLSTNETEKSEKNLTSQEKFHIVMETYALNEVELGEYARKQGVFLYDIKEWKENCFSANEKKVKISKDEKKLLEESLKCGKEKDKIIKSQEKELIRKEKALAEAAALLILSKKAKAIWGESEDE